MTLSQLRWPLRSSAPDATRASTTSCCAGCCAGCLISNRIVPAAARNGAVTLTAWVRSARCELCVLHPSWREHLEALKQQRYSVAEETQERRRRVARLRRAATKWERSLHLQVCALLWLFRVRRRVLSPLPPSRDGLFQLVLQLKKYAHPCRSGAEPRGRFHPVCPGCRTLCG